MKSMFGLYKRSVIFLFLSLTFVFIFTTDRLNGENEKSIYQPAGEHEEWIHLPRISHRHGWYFIRKRALRGVVVYIGNEPDSISEVGNQLKKINDAGYNLVSSAPAIASSDTVHHSVSWMSKDEMTNLLRVLRDRLQNQKKVFIIDGVHLPLFLDVMPHFPKTVTALIILNPENSGIEKHKLLPMMKTLSLAIPVMFVSNKNYFNANEKESMQSHLPSGFLQFVQIASPSMQKKNAASSFLDTLFDNESIHLFLLMHRTNIPWVSASEVFAKGCHFFGNAEIPIHIVKYQTSAFGERDFCPYYLKDATGRLYQIRSMDSESCLYRSSATGTTIKCKFAQ